MTPRHHLDSATLVSHAAGALSPALAAVAATHLDACAHCRGQLAQAEQVGGALLQQQQPASPSARATELRSDILVRLQQPLPAPTESAPLPAHLPTDILPRALQPYFGRTWKALHWRWVAPGVHMIRAGVSTGDTLVMLKIAPGKSMPVHGHQGCEITQILRGAYPDSLGCFAAGDVADLDADTEHQPVILPGAACVCVAALDAPLRFPGWFARRLQPLFGV